MIKENNKSLPLSIKIAAYILIGLGIACTLICLISNGFSIKQNISGAIELIGIIVGALYFYKGAGKPENTFYKSYFLIFSLTFVAEYAIFSIFGGHKDYVADNELFIQMFIDMLCYGNYLVLALAKDLGKKMSLGLAIASAVLYLIYLIPTFTDLAYYTPSQTTFEVAEAVSYLASSAFNIIIVYAKYFDKDARGTK